MKTFYMSTIIIPILQIPNPGIERLGNLLITISGGSSMQTQMV